MGEKLGRRVADLRAKRGWTQQQLADRIAVSRVAVSHLESGLSDPSERTVTLMAGVFGLEPHELVAGTTYPDARVDRLPVVAARFTEVEHQLILLESDLAWLVRTGGTEQPRVVAEWTVRLDALLADAHDPEEREQLTAARRRLSDLR
jgi:transcriptional regulator with XRE-family HTH domain